MAGRSFSSDSLDKGDEHAEIHRTIVVTTKRQKQTPSQACEASIACPASDPLNIVLADQPPSIIDTTSSSQLR